MYSRTLVAVLALALTGSVAYAESSFKEGAKEVGTGVKDIGNGGAHEMAEGTKTMGKATGETVKSAGKSTGKAFKKAGKATKNAGKKTGTAFKDAGKKTKDTVKGE